MLSKNIKTALAAVFFLSAPLLIRAASKSSTSQIPDFAYPKTVISEAEKNLSNRSNTPEMKLRAMLDLTVADNLIDSDMIFKLLPQIDSISRSLPSPYSSVGFLIEAGIYQNIYASNASEYNVRTVDNGFSDHNPNFWDREQFETRIRDLLKLSLSDKIAKDTPLSNISKLIEPETFSEDYTVYDFIVYKAIELEGSFGNTPSVIPFYKEINDSGHPFSSIDLIDSLLSLHPNPSEPRNTAVMTKFYLLPQGEQRKEFLWNEILSYGDSPFAMPLISDYYDTYLSSRYDASGKHLFESPDFQTFRLHLADLQHESKDKEFLSELQKIENRINAPFIDFSYPSVVECNKSFSVSLDVENVSDFYLLLLEAPATNDNYIKAKDLRGLRVIDTQKVHIDKDIPFFSDYITDFSVVKPGKYTIVASQSESVSDVFVDKSLYSIPLFMASDIDLIAINSLYEITGDAEGCFVVNSADSSPVEGASVVFSPYNNKLPQEKAFTDIKGFAKSNIKNGEIKASYRGSSSYSSVYHNSQTITARTQINLFSSQAVYRLGDKLEFFGIVSRNRQNNGNPLNDCSLNIYLRDANYNIIDSLSCVSDESGRFFGTFAIPESGMLGSWGLTAKTVGNKEKTLQNYNTSAYLPFEVADYSVPSFLISLEKEGVASDSIRFKGIAATYSGMPIGLCRADFTVTYRPDYFGRWYGIPQQSFTSHTFTDTNGEFIISLPLENLDVNNYRGTFTLTVTITDDAGQTVESSPLAFFLKSSYNLIADIPGKIDISNDDLSLNIKVTDQTGLPVRREVNYTLLRDKEKVTEGCFMSPNLSLSTAGLQPGRYKFNFSIDGEEADTIVCETVLYRASDKTLPFETALWVPENTVTIPSDSEMTEIEFGSSFSGQNILCILTDSEGEVSWSWIVSDGKMNSLRVPVPGQDTRTFIKFLTYSNHKPYSENVTLIPAEQNEKFTIATESFRTAVSSGDRETWKFRLLKKDTPVSGFAYALLYDKAMDAISPLNWVSSLFVPYYPCMVSLYASQSYPTNYSYLESYRESSYPGVVQFDFNTYGYPLYSRFFTRNGFQKLMSAKTEAISYGATDDYAARSNIGFAEETAFEDDAETGSNEFDPDNSQLIRPIEMPVAFFRPNLRSNQKGEILLDFIVPDFNTTWKLLLGAYDEELNSSLIQLETVASKKVMVKMNSPRFLRTGDRVELKATIFNNTSEPLFAYGVYEIFDPVSGKILLTTRSEERDLEPSANHVFAQDFLCPSDLNIIGLRVYGKSGDNSDGEETVIPVLPSSQPVIDSFPFYLHPDQSEFTMHVPELKENSTVTFTYCDNPVWEVVTALTPVSRTKGTSIFPLMESLYADCVGTGLMKKYPDIRKGLERILSGETGDSLLVSNLQKNENLKIGLLENTPWVNTAASETLRLSCLSSLLDSVRGSTAINETWMKLQQLRNPDGGLSWCPGMESSLWTTRNYLLYMGLLKGNGFLPELPNFNLSVKSAFSFCEKEILKEYNRLDSKGKESYVGGLYTFLYVKSMYPEIVDINGFSTVNKAAMRSLERNWKSLDILSKAMAAMIFKRDGKEELALEVLASLKEYSSSSDDGIYFANLTFSNGSGNKLSVTATVLSAFCEINPSDSIVKGLCQWLLLQKQTQDWKDGASGIYTVNALLSASTGWTQSFDSPIINIGGKKLPADEISRMTGSCKVTLSAEDLGGKEISILRSSSSPAWGSVICQYIEPMEEIEAFSTGEIRINKTFVVLQEDSGKVTGNASKEFNTGSRVRVTLEIECDRDMDFVVLTDERSACMEPVEQLSGYVCIDGIWLYREIRNNATNFYIPFLAAGRHLVSYDTYISQEGEFSNGIAAIQCLYYPGLTARSSGSVIQVN